MSLTEEIEAPEISKLWRWVSEQRRYLGLCGLLAQNKTRYTEVAGTLHLVYGVDRLKLPNLEDVPASVFEADPLRPLTSLPNVTFVESPWEKALLFFTRQRYAVHAETHYKSKERGITGLLAEMLVLARKSDVDTQKNAVLFTLRDLMTPLLPPFYRFFVTQKPWQDFSTSVVAPIVFGYLVGPSTVNRRSDGQLGGLVVHRCKFLQDSGCKGLCLHSCKLPAQELFQEDLGVPLSVMPNFQTLECQWSWGQEPLLPTQDPKWPKGCLPDCPSRHLLLNDDDEQQSEENNKKSSKFCS